MQNPFRVAGKARWHHIDRFLQFFESTSHSIIDHTKAKLGRADSIQALLLDQAAHGLVMLLSVRSMPYLAPQGAAFWVQVLGPVYLQGLVLISGFVLTVQAGGVLIKQAVQPYS